MRENKIPPTVEKEDHHTKESHESYGVVSISRQSGNYSNLFGSPLRHDEVFVLTVYGADKHRSHSEDRYYGNLSDRKVEIQLSPHQFMDMITKHNVGSGVPCTITYADGRTMDGCPETNERQVFDDEMKERFDELSKTTCDLMKETKEVLNKKSILKSDRENLKSLINKIEMEIKSNMPFYKERFTESMEKTITAAASEIEARMHQTVMDYGLAAIKDKLLGDTSEEQHLIEQEKGES